MWKNKGERDAAEVRRVLAGDREHFGVLVERYLPGVCAVASAHLHNLADAEDASQEAFVKAYVSLDKLRDPNHFSAWLMTIARNTARGTLRRRDRASSAVDEMKDSELAAMPDPAADDTRRLVRAHIDQLDPDFREALLLHYFAGLSSREMGRSLGISPAGARKRLQRARAALTVSMTRELHELRPDTDRLRERKESIAKAVIATTAGWSAATASGGAATATAAAWSLLPSAKLLAGAALGIAATVGLGWYIVQQADDRATLAQSEATPVAQQPSQDDPQDENSLVRDFSLTDTSDGRDNVRAPSAVVVEIADELPSLGTGKTDSEVEAEIQKPIGLVFEDIHVVKLMTYVQKVRDLSVFFDTKAIYIPKPIDYDAIGTHLNKRADARDSISHTTNGIFDAIDIREQKLWDAMDSIVDALGLAYISEPGFIWISTQDRINREVIRLPYERFDSYENEDAFDQTISLVFEDVHLQDVLKFVVDTYEVTIAVDSRVVKPEKQSEMKLSGYVPEGFATDGVSYFLDLRQIQARDALRAILRPLNLTYRVQWGAIVISTNARFSSGLVTPQDLMNADEAGSAITRMIGDIDASGFAFQNPQFGENGTFKADRVIATTRQEESVTNDSLKTHSTSDHMPE